MKRGPILLGVAAVLAMVLLASAPSLIGLLVDWRWFGAVEFRPVFVNTLVAKVGLGVGVSVIAFAVFYLNLRFAQRGLVPDPVVVNINAKTPKVDVTRVAQLLTLPGSAALAVLVGLSASTGWATLLRFVHRTPFGVTDPEFGRDIGYYFFTLPAVSAVVSLGGSLLALTLALVGPLYLLRGDVVVRHRRFTIEPSAARHLGVLAAGLFTLVAIAQFGVRIPTLVLASGGAHFGAGYADVAARLPLLRAAGAVALLGAGLTLWGAQRRQLPRYLAISGGLLALTLVAGGVYPAAIQKFLVAPNELVRERPFIERHIEATRVAWGLSDVQVRDITGDSGLTLNDVRANSGTVRNVRLWDRDPLRQTFGQLQEIRTYYDFVSVDDDRYQIDGEYRQVLLSPRELNSASLPTRNFINERLTFTHGMGLTLSPVNQVTPQGLPTLFIRNLPPTSDVSLQITRPQIYFGELSNEYVFVNTRQPEFDYPSGDSTATTVYDGPAGVRVGGLVGRALLSMRFRALKIFLSQDITRDSRVLMYRRVQERAAKALPFLLWDADPYIVISEEGHLKWILDAYTQGQRYPYAQPLGNGTNYLRNSVKVVIDAYDGTIHPYVADPDDPVIQTYGKMFPGILRSFDELPSDLRAHIRYPDDLFRAQTFLYTTYHMDEPSVFYHREDQWQIPSVAPSEGSRDPYLRHIVMRLPGEEREEYIAMTPFTPRQKDNLAAWMVARNDGDHYGELRVYRFPRQSLVFGPTQIVNRINQDTDISRQISLWDQRGSQVIRGNLLVIPIEESLLFVQALYLQAEGGRIPELKRVIVAYQDAVVMEETLEVGLARLFGGAVDERARDGSTRPAAAAGGETTAAADGAMVTEVANLIRRAEAAYRRALDAQRTGDWSTYGREMDEVGTLLRELRTRAAGGGS